MISHNQSATLYPHPTRRFPLFFRLAPRSFCPSFSTNRLLARVVDGMLVWATGGETPAEAEAIGGVERRGGAGESGVAGETGVAVEAILVEVEAILAEVAAISDRRSRRA